MGRLDELYERDKGIKNPPLSLAEKEELRMLRGGEMIKEKDFQKQVIDTARLLGWKVAHFRGVRIQRKNGSVYYQTPVQGDGAGFPDCVLVKDGRLIFAELKLAKGKLTEQQGEWLSMLAEVPNVEVYLWKPSEFDKIVEILSGAEGV